MFGSLLEEDIKPNLRALEEHALQRGYKHIAGIDEAGRGALAGPVVAAAVMFPEGIVVPGINDSKKLTASKREKLYYEILEKSSATGIGISEHHLIDEINILQATLISMKNAVLNLPILPDYILVDGNCAIPLNIQQKTVVRGDSSSISIAAASIIAKVTRDKLMLEYSKIFSGYGFADHKGYGCASHLAAIAELGPCNIHRKTFRGVKEYITKEASEQILGTML